MSLLLCSRRLVPRRLLTAIGDVTGLDTTEALALRRLFWVRALGGSACGASAPATEELTPGAHCRHRRSWGTACAIATEQKGNRTRWTSRRMQARPSALTPDCLQPGLGSKTR